MLLRNIGSKARCGRSRTAALALAAIFALAVIACGSDNEPAALPTQAAQAPVATATQAPAPPTQTTAPEPTESPAVDEAPATSGPSGSGDSGDLVIPVGELNSSGQTGIATLSAMGGQTKVVVSISSGAAGVSQPIHVHSGTCDTLGGVEYPLTAVSDGSSVTVIDVALSSLKGGANAINVHLSGDEVGTYVACGDIPAEGSSVTIALDELNGSGQPGLATLIESGSQTTVIVSIAPGAVAAQPIHIHSGTCDTLGGVELPLTAVAAGVSVTTVDSSLQALLDGEFAINVHESPENAGNYVSCGTIEGGSDGGSAAMAGDSGDLVIPVGELNSSGQTGIATLSAMGGQTKVVVSISSGAAGVSQPIHVHSGTCDTLGGVEYPLTAVSDGSSVTVIDVALSSLKGGANAINVHLSGDEVGTYVACGDIPAEGSSVTIALDELNGSGQPGLATLIESGSQTTVIVSIAPGAVAAQPIHIHSGTCDTLGGVELPLTAVAAGVSVTTVDSSLQALLDGEFAINVHESPENAGNYVSCGTIEGGSIVSQAPTQSLGEGY